MPDDPQSLARPTRRQLLLGGAMLASAGIGWAAIPRKRELLIGNEKLEKMVPLQIGPWRYETSAGLVLPPSDALSNALYDQTLTRTYLAPDLPPMMLLIAYGSTQSDLLQIHRPEICYPTGGLKVSDYHREPVRIGGRRDTVPAIAFTATAPGRTEQVLYWIRVGDFFPRTWALQHLSRMAENLQGVVSDGVLVRASTITENKPLARAMLQKFVSEMVAGIDPAHRNVLLGNDLNARLARSA
jgi:EpsI family protein